MPLRLISILGIIPTCRLSRQKFAYKLEINEFRGNRNLQLLVDYIEQLLIYEKKFGRINY